MAGGAVRGGEKVRNEQAGRREPPFARWPVLAVVVGVGALLLAVSGGYGYHRDELYFVACGRRLAWGYPDQGPLTPFLAHLMDAVGPGSPTVLRLPAVACALGTVVLSALIARSLGGGVFAQGLTAVVVGTGVLTLIAGHLLATASVDLLVWVAIVYLVVRILAAPPGARDRLWLAVGLVAGIGLLNKALPAVLLLGLLAGGLLTPAVRPRLRSPWLWGGAAVALVCWAPYLAWQAANGWPQLELGRQIAREYGAGGERVGFVLLQLVMFGFAGAYLWITGALRSLRRREPSRGPARPPWQPVLGWAWLVVVAVFVVTAGQGYYGAGVYPPLVAAGAVGLEARLRRGWSRALVVAAVLVGAAVVAPIALPLLPARTLQESSWGGSAETQFDTVGWPRLVDDVAAAYRSAPGAVLFASNYGEAGALEVFGPSRGLPATTYSGHNAFGWWGPPPETGRPVVAVAEDGPPRALTSCRSVGRVRNDEGVSNEETAYAAIYVCGPPAQGWAAAWPQLRHLSS